MMKCYGGEIGDTLAKAFGGEAGDADDVSAHVLGDDVLITVDIGLGQSILVEGVADSFDKDIDISFL